MQLNSTEIADLIKQRISQFSVVSEARNEGTIVSVSDGIIRIHGLTDVMSGEMIELPGGLYGLALNLERDCVGAIVLGPYENLREGQKVFCTGKILEVPVGEDYSDAWSTPSDSRSTERARSGMTASHRSRLSPLA